MTPRLLTIMGSGETSPTMVKVHRMLLERVGGAPALLLDTPFGFQTNAGEIAARIVAYFRDSLRCDIAVAGMLGRGSFVDEHLTSKVRAAGYVFSGPGSPTYALRKWRETVVPQLIGEKLEHGGAVTFASAAALTVGMATVPVYEIYKVGEDAGWLEGLDLLACAGLRAAVVPHYDNAEGGTHDTRYCYLGEERLAFMEELLPEGAFVLGVDEHTALVLDLDEGSASVHGNGVVTVRAAGRSETFGSGTTVAIAHLAATADRLRAGGDTARAGAGDPPARIREREPERPKVNPLREVVRDAEEAFAKALAAREVDGAVQAALSLEQQLVDWATDIPDSDTFDRARASLRSMVVELGHAARAGVQDPAEVVGPYVESLLELRRRAREAKRFDESDDVRDRLTRLGVEVRDTPAGAEWLLAPTPDPEVEG